MKLAMGIMIALMGVAMLSQTPWAFIQIAAGALLCWKGVQDELKKNKT